MLRKLKKKYNKFIKDKFLITNFEGDSNEYEIFDSSVKRLSSPIGSSFEIGVRRGMGSKMIIDAYRKYHPSLYNHVHIGLDPYGELPYNFSEDRKSNTNHDYTNLMKREMIINFSKKYKEFNFVNLDTFEFFKWFDNVFEDLIAQMLPRKTSFMGVNFVIESHILERHKMKYGFDQMWLLSKERDNDKGNLFLSQVVGTVRRF